MKRGLLILYLALHACSLFAQVSLIPNLGQFHTQDGIFNSDVKFMHYGEDINVQLTNGGFSFDLLKRKSEDSINFFRSDIQLSYKNQNYNNVKWRSGYESGKSFNYYNNLGHFSNVKGFKNVIGNLEGPVKIEFRYESDTVLKYDIHCRAIDLEYLEFKINGPNSIRVDSNQLIFRFKDFEFVDEISESFTKDGENIRVIWESIGANRIRFKLLDDINPEDEIIIDPSVSLKWSTYYGDNSNEQGYGAASTQDGHAIFCGRISSRSMATSGTHQSTIGGSDDAFLVKMHKDGGSNSRIWATYFGGSGIDYAHDVFVSSKNEILLTGRTASGNGISKNARYKSSRTGKYDAFFAKFAGDGTLEWANYLGGKEDDIGLGIATDSSQNVLVVGFTESSSGISSRKNSNYTIHQSSRSSNKDGFIGKFDKDGNRLFVSYFGGAGNDIANSVIALANDTIAFVGETNSNSITTSSTSFAGRTDGFITKLSPNGRLFKFIFLGDTLDDALNKIRYFNPFIYVTGTTNSTSNMALNGHQNILNIGSGAVSTNTDAFLAKFSPNLKKLWATYYGGDDYEWGNDIGTDIKGYIYLVGTTKSYNSNRGDSFIIATDGAFIESLQGGTDAFLVKFDDDGNRVWATYFGAIGNDYGNGLSHGRYGDVYICGETNSNRNLVYRPYQSTYGGSVDAFFADLYYCKLKAFLHADTVCYGEPLNIYFADSSAFLDTSSADIWGRTYSDYYYTWYKPGDTIGNDSFNSIYTIDPATYNDTGLYTLIVMDSFGCVDTASILITDGNIYEPPDAYISSGSSFCQWDTLWLRSTSGLNSNFFNYYWSKDNIKIDSSKGAFIYPAIRGVHDGQYILTVIDSSDANGCVLNDTIDIDIGAIDVQDSIAFVCPKDSIDLLSYIGDTTRIDSAYWRGPNGFFSLKRDTIIVAFDSSYLGEYQLFVADSNDCRDTFKLQLRFKLIQSLSLTYEDHYCENDSIGVELRVTDGDTNSSYSWLGPNSFTDTTTELNFIADTSLNGRYDVTITSDLYCPLDTSLDIYVTNNPRAELRYDSVLCVGDTLNIEYSNYVGSLFWYSNYIIPMGDTITTNPYSKKTSLIDSGRYAWILVDTFNCQYDSIFDISVLPYQSLSLTYEDHYCENDSIGVELRVTDGDTNSSYSWLGPNSFTDTTTELNFIADTSLNGRYDVTITSDLYCPLDTSLDIYVTNNPRAELRYDSVLCVGDTLNIEYSNYVGSLFWYSNYIIPMGDTITTNPYSKKTSLIDSGRYAWILVDTFNCQYDSIFTIDINPLPLSDFNFKSSFCSNDNIEFIDNSKGRSLKYNWEFDSSASISNSNSAGPLFVNFSDTGINSVKLTVESSDGCFHDTTKSFLVYDYPRAKISLSSDTACFRSNVIRFIDSSVYNGRSKIVSVNWYFDSLLTGSSKDTHNGFNPVDVSYSFIGNKSITLVVADSLGCSDTADVSVTILDHPNAEIYHTDTNLCKRSNKFKFVDSSLKTTLNLNKWFWNFDVTNSPKRSNVDTSNSKGPHEVVYSDTGSYLVSLVASDDFGCKDTAFSKVYVRNEPRSIYTPFDSTGCVNKTIFKITNSSTLNGKPIRNQNWFINGKLESTDSILSFTSKTRGPLNGELINTTKFGCSDTVKFTLLVDTLPDIQIKSDTQCISGNKFYFENIANNYSQKIHKYYWDFGDGDKDSSNVPNALKTYDSIGVYKVQLAAVTPYGCDDTTAVDIIIGRDPLAGISIVQDLVCYNTPSAVLQAYGLSGNQPFRYFWYGDTNLVDTRLTGVGVGNHFVIVRDRFDCYDTAEILMIRPDSLNSVMESNHALCKGDNSGRARVSAFGGSPPYNYQWNVPRFQYMDTLLDLKAGEYKVTITDSKGCEITDSTEIFEPDSLRVNISLDQPILCSGDKNGILETQVTGGTKPYRYSLNFSAYSNSNKFDSLGSGIYSIRVLDTNGCKNQDTITVIQPIPLSVSYTVDSLICYGDSSANIVTFPVGGTKPYFYTWEKEGDYLGGDSFLPNIPSGKYNFKLYDRYGCETQREINIISPFPFQGDYEYPAKICDGGEVKFYSKNAPNRTIWTKGLNSYGLDTLRFKPFTFNDTGWYGVQMFNELGCPYKDSFRVDLFPGATISRDTVVCEGDPFRLQVFNSISTNWIGPINNRFNGSIVFKPVASILDSGIYTAYTQSPNGCRDTLNINLEVRPRPWLSLSPLIKREYCEGERLMLIFRASEPLKNKWYGPNSGMIAENTDSYVIEELKSSDEGKYTIQVESNIGCKSQVDTVVKVGKKPDAIMQIGPTDNCFLANRTALTFLNRTKDFVTQLLYYNDSLVSVNLPFSSIQGKEGDIDVKLVVINSDGCSDSIEYTLGVLPEPEIYVPNSFTPNGDFTNPYFLPYMNESIKQFKIRIYNRWGEKVYEFEGDNDPGSNKGGWDGYFNDDLCQEGLYIYILQYSTICNEKEFIYPLRKKGWVYLLR